MSPQKRRLIRSILIVLGAIFVAFFAFLWTPWPASNEAPSIRPGVTFSVPYAEELGLNWREALIATLDDLGVRRFRIPAYWSIAEPSRDAFDWSSLDFQMNEIGMRDGRVLLAVGLKLPRWPECWMPDWAGDLSTEDEHAARLDYLRAVVERYKDHPALHAWQVENEALFPFGDCPKPSKAFLNREINLVRSLDPDHPVVVTDSGELATWLSVGPLADRLGVSVYRVVRLPWGWVWPYDWVPPHVYRRHAALVSPWVKDIFVSEFQMEPWVEGTIPETPVDQQLETFNVERMQKNFVYAERMRVSDVYFWGVEWWWWMKTQQGDARFWEIAKVFF